MAFFLVRNIIEFLTDRKALAIFHHFTSSCAAGIGIRRAEREVEAGSVLP
jgi:hypothetical protein